MNVSGPEMSILIRTTLIALHDANVTGNYTVLRDLGATTLQAANTAADLAAQFADFRKKQIGLAPTVLYDPVLDQKPALSTDGQLRLIGHFPINPEVDFDLTYLYQAGAWRIALIRSAPTPLPTPARPVGKAHRRPGSRHPPRRRYRTPSLSVRRTPAAVPRRRHRPRSRRHRRRLSARAPDAPPGNDRRRAGSADERRSPSAG